jgi:hypothetical protein
MSRSQETGEIVVQCQAHLENTQSSANVKEPVVGSHRLEDPHDVCVCAAASMPPSLSHPPRSGDFCL